MLWKKTSPSIIAKYDNGNHRVTLFSDGTKIKDKKIKLINDVVSKLQKEKINLNKTVEAKDQECEKLKQQFTIIENRIKDMEKINNNLFERLANW